MTNKIEHKTVTMVSMKFINLKALSSALTLLVHYSPMAFDFINFIDTLVHVFNYYMRVYVSSYINLPVPGISPSTLC